MMSSIRAKMCPQKNVVSRRIAIARANSVGLGKQFVYASFLFAR